MWYVKTLVTSCGHCHYIYFIYFKFITTTVVPGTSPGTSQKITDRSSQAYIFFVFVLATPTTLFTNHPLLPPHMPKTKTHQSPFFYDDDFYLDNDNDHHELLRSQALT